MPGMKYFKSCAPLLILLSLLAACSSPLSKEDQEALSTLEVVAQSTSQIEATGFGDTECWVPSQHVIDPNQNPSIWKVICRVHYTENSIKRWRDTTCMGDFSLSPMLERCWRWVPYTGEPAFEDHEAVSVDS